MTGHVLPRHFFAVCMIAAAGLFAGHQGFAQERDVPLDLLGQWQAETIEGTAVVAGSASLLEFEEAGTVDGNGGCNIIFGPLRTEDRSIRIGPLSVTRKSCPPEILNQEKDFLKALDKTRDFKRMPGEKALILLDGQGVEVVRLIEVQ